MYAMGMGVMQRDPVISHAVGNNQLFINSPAFSAPLYGIAGGGLITAVRSESNNPDTTALDIPAGHTCSFGDRFAIGAGPFVYFNDPGVDPRVFVDINAKPFPGAVYDVMQGPGGSLFVFTTAGLYTVAADALGQGQDVSGFISRVPGLETSRPRNAIAAAGRVIVLQRDGVQIVDGQKIGIAASVSRRFWSKAVEVEDFRQVGELYPVPGGFIVGFRGRRGHFLTVDLERESASWTTSTQSSLSAVGTLRSRDGEALIVLRDRVVVPHGNADFDAATIRGVAVGSLETAEDDRPVVRRVTVSGANVGQTNGVTVNGEDKTSTTAARTGDFVIGTSLWSADDVRYAGRTARTTRHGFNVRASEPAIEVRFDGGDRRIEATVDIEVNGQGRRRRDGGG
jgi:hypothetical protein